MPYIKQEERKELDTIIDSLSEKFTHVGQLNYIITRICHNWILKFGKRYVHINSVMGVLNCVTHELYRVVAAPYEDEKIAENGGITELDTFETDADKELREYKEITPQQLRQQLEDEGVEFPED